MNLYQTIGVVAQAWLAAARAARRAEVWTPLLMLTGVPAGVLLGLIYFYVPGLSPIAEPIVRGLGGEIATHYPDHYWALPKIFWTADVFITVLVGSLTFAVATLSFARAPGGWASTKTARCRCICSGSTRPRCCCATCACCGIDSSGPWSPPRLQRFPIIEVCAASSARSRECRCPCPRTGRPPTAT